MHSYYLHVANYKGDVLFNTSLLKEVRSQHQLHTPLKESDSRTRNSVDDEGHFP